MLIHLNLAFLSDLLHASWLSETSKEISLLIYAGIFCSLHEAYGRKKLFPLIVWLLYFLPSKMFSILYRYALFNLDWLSGEWLERVTTWWKNEWGLRNTKCLHRVTSSSLRLLLFWGPQCLHLHSWYVLLMFKFYECISMPWWFSFVVNVAQRAIGDRIGLSYLTTVKAQTCVWTDDSTNTFILVFFLLTYFITERFMCVRPHFLFTPYCLRAVWPLSSAAHFIMPYWQSSVTSSLPWTVVIFQSLFFKLSLSCLDRDYSHIECPLSRASEPLYFPGFVRTFLTTLLVVVSSTHNIPTMYNFQNSDINSTIYCLYMLQLSS